MVRRIFIARLPESRCREPRQGGRDSLSTAPSALLLRRLPLSLLLSRLPALPPLLEEPRGALLWAGLGLGHVRSEEHTSELQSHVNLVCRLLLEKKKKNK